jgi:hypothetical protein
MENEQVKTKFRPATMGEALPFLRLASGDDVQSVGLENILDGCIYFVMGDEFAYALKRQGDELWIQAAGGRSQQDLTKAGFANIEAQAAGLYKSVGFQTRRSGLVKKAQREGYEIDGYIMRKKINV